MHGRCGRFARRRDGSIHLVHSKWTLIRNSFPQLCEAGLCERSHFSYGFQLLLFPVRLTRTVWLPRSFNQWRTDVAGIQTSWWHVWSSDDRTQILPIYLKCSVFPNKPFRMTFGKLDEPTCVSPFAWNPSGPPQSCGSGWHWELCVFERFFTSTVELLIGC